MGSEMCIRDSLRFTILPRLNVIGLTIHEIFNKKHFYTLWSTQSLTPLSRMFSIEPACSKAYSSDMRWRMVYQRCVLGLSYREIGEKLTVDLSTVHRTVKLRQEQYIAYKAIMKGDRILENHLYSFFCEN